MSVITVHELLLEEWFYGNVDDAMSANDVRSIGDAYEVISDADWNDFLCFLDNYACLFRHRHLAVDCVSDCWDQ